MTKIKFTDELSELLDQSGVSKSFPQFKRYGETLGYINIRWFIDPSTYKKECKMIDLIYSYKKLNHLYIDNNKIIEIFGSEEKFENGLLLESIDNCKPNPNCCRLF